jgi:rubrerythrin
VVLVEEMPVMDDATRAVLEASVRRENRSFLQYVAEAFPWTSPAEQNALARIKKLIAEERQGAAALGRFLVRHKLPVPPLGVYPVEFTNFNYVSLDHLLPLLVQFEEKSIAQMESDLEAVKDSEARAQLHRLLDMKQHHLRELKQLAAAHGSGG